MKILNIRDYDCKKYFAPHTRRQLHNCFVLLLKENKWFGKCLWWVIVSRDSIPCTNHCTPTIALTSSYYHMNIGYKPVTFINASKHYKVLSHLCFEGTRKEAIRTVVGWLHNVNLWGVYEGCRPRKAPRKA